MVLLCCTQDQHVCAAECAADHKLPLADDPSGEPDASSPHRRSVHDWIIVGDFRAIWCDCEESAGLSAHSRSAAIVRFIFLHRPLALILKHLERAWMVEVIVISLTCCCVCARVCSAGPDWTVPDDARKPTATTEAMFCALGMTTVFAGYGVYTGMCVRECGVTVVCRVLCRSHTLGFACVSVEARVCAGVFVRAEM